MVKLVEISYIFCFKKIVTFINKFNFANNVLIYYDINFYSIERAQSYIIVIFYSKYIINHLVIRVH